MEPVSRLLRPVGRYSKGLASATLRLVSANVALLLLTTGLTAVRRSARVIGTIARRGL